MTEAFMKITISGQGIKDVEGIRLVCHSNFVDDEVTLEKGVLMCKGRDVQWVELDTCN